jgi:hypothetical protein
VGFLPRMLTAWQEPALPSVSRRNNRFSTDDKLSSLESTTSYAHVNPQAAMALHIEGSALARLVALDRLVDDIEPSAAADDAIIPVALSERLDGISDLHCSHNAARAAGRLCVPRSRAASPMSGKILPRQ